MQDLLAVKVQLPLSLVWLIFDTYVKGVGGYQLGITIKPNKQYTA